MIRFVQKKRVVLDESPVYFTLGNISSRGPEEKRMIGDFDSSANALWALYGKGAKSHDEAQIQPLKEDMDGVLIFVRPYFVHTCRFSRANSYPNRLVYFPPPSQHS